MTARPNWFWSSLFSSLTVNAVLFVSAACWLYSHTPIWQPAWPSGTSAPVDDSTPFFIPHIADTLLGESTGKGTATDATPGDAPMEARLADQDQSFLSRDPAGPGHIGDPSSLSTQLPGENGTGQPGQPTKFGIAQNENFPTAQPVFAQPKQSARPARAQPNAAKPNPEQPTPSNQTSTKTPPDQADNSDSDATKTTVAIPLIAQSSEIDKPQPTPTTQPQVDWRSAVASIAEASPALQRPQQQPQPDQSQPAQQSQPTANTSPTATGKPGPAKPAADPAPQSDTDSDPFTTKGSVKFKQGSTEVQFGRKHTIVHPQFGLGAQTDLLQLRQPVVLILALHLDETGSVRHVDILQSSGSDNIDEACKTAAYQWKLEPTKDKNGKPIKDVIPFTIGFS
jgi:TonB family protein